VWTPIKETFKSLTGISIYIDRVTTAPVRGSFKKPMYPLYVSKLLDGLLLYELPDFGAVYPDEVHAFGEVGNVYLYL